MENSDKDRVYEEDEGLEFADEDELQAEREDWWRTIEAEVVEEVHDLIEFRPEKTIRLPPHSNVYGCPAGRLLDVYQVLRF